MTCNQTAIILALIAGWAVWACKGKDTDIAGLKTGDKVSVVKEKRIEPPAQKPALKPAEFRGPGERLVKSAGKWTLTGNPRYFGPDNLEELIDGGAELYAAYGLKEMVIADYTSPDKPKVTVTAEIYDMGSPLNAFGRFSKFLQGKEDPASAGKELPKETAARGLFGGANASFWNGSYLVNLTLLDESDTATLESTTALGIEVILPLVSALDTGISGETALPNETSLFPKSHLVAQSFLFEPALLQIPALGPGFLASYKQGADSCTVFVTQRFADAAALDNALKSAQKALNSRSITAKADSMRIIGYAAPDKPSDKTLAEKTLKEMSSLLKSHAD